MLHKTQYLHPSDNHNQRKFKIYHIDIKHRYYMLVLVSVLIKGKQKRILSFFEVKENAFSPASKQRYLKKKKKENKTRPSMSSTAW